MKLHRRGVLVAAGAVLSSGAVGAATGRDRPRSGTAAGADDGQSDGYAPLGTVEVPGARETAVAGDAAYVATRDGFAVVDISDPATPEILAERRTVTTDTDQPLLGIWDLWPWADRLVVAGPAQSSANVPSGIALFDVSDPAAPEQVAFHRTEHHIHNTYFTDGTVYLTGRDEGRSVVMVDVTDDDPVEVGRWSPLAVDERWAEVESSLRSLHDVYVQDGRAYLPYWDAGTWIVDVSDPADPAALGHVAQNSLAELLAVPPGQSYYVSRTPGGAAHYAQVNEEGTLLLVGRETWAIDDPAGRVSDPGTRVGGASGVDLYDITDPSSPEHRATVEPPASFDQRSRGWFTTAHNADIRDNRLYTSWYFGGVAIHDVSNPSDPVELARWQDPRAASFWTARAADGFVVASSVDISTVFGGLPETRGALYTFPDESGAQVDPPVLTERPEELFGTAPEDPPEVDRTAGMVSQVVDLPGGAPEDSAGGDGGPSDSGDGTDNGSTAAADTDRGADGDGPGLGVGAALAGLGGYLLARRAGHLSESRSE